MPARGRATRFFILFTLLFSASAQLHAQQQQQYISDVLFVPLRSGQGNEYRIVNKGLKSGTPLTFVEAGDSGEWSKVRTESGVEGWIRNQYLMETEPSTLKLSRALAQVARLSKTNTELASENAELKSANSTLNNQAENLGQSQTQMAAELEKIRTLSAGAIDLEQRYTELLEKHQLLQTRADVLSAENESLKNDTRVNFMDLSD